MFLALLLSSGVKVNDLQQSETRPTTYMLMILFCLLQYPVPAALFGLAWIVGRLAYFQV